MYYHLILYYYKDTFLQLREIFAILTQGVELIQYDVKNAKRGVTKFKRILWMVCLSIFYSILLFYIIIIIIIIIIIMYIINYDYIIIIGSRKFKDMY